MNTRVKTTIVNLYAVLCAVLVLLGLISLIAVGFGIRPYVMISESMMPYVPKNSLVLLDTHRSFTDISVGDNVAYLLEKVVALHRVDSITSDGTEVVVKSLADNGESVVTASTYVGKQIAAIPNIGGWVREVLKAKWAVVIVAAGFIVVGCIPGRKKDTVPETVDTTP